MKKKNLKEKYEKSAQDEQTELNNAGEFLSNYGEPSVRPVVLIPVSQFIYNVE